MIETGEEIWINERRFGRLKRPVYLSRSRSGFTGLGRRREQNKVVEGRSRIMNPSDDAILNI